MATRHELPVDLVWATKGRRALIDGKVGLVVHEALRAKSVAPRITCTWWRGFTRRSHWRAWPARRKAPRCTPRISISLRAGRGASAAARLRFVHALRRRSADLERHVLDQPRRHAQAETVEDAEPPDDPPGALDIADRAAWPEMAQQAHPDNPTAPRRGA